MTLISDLSGWAVELRILFGTSDQMITYKKHTDLADGRDYNIENDVIREAT